MKSLTARFNSPDSSGGWHFLHFGTRSEKRIKLKAVCNLGSASIAYCSSLNSLFAFLVPQCRKWPPSKSLEFTSGDGTSIQSQVF